MCSYFGIQAPIFHLLRVDFWPLPNFVPCLRSIFCKAPLSGDRAIWAIHFRLEKLLFGDLVKVRIDAFNRICCVNNFSNSTSVIEKLLYMVEISLPYIYCSRVLRPLLTELFNGFSRGCKARCSVLLCVNFCSPCSAHIWLNFGLNAQYNAGQQHP